MGSTGPSMAVKHCSSSREGKVLLSCWILAAQQES